MERNKRITALLDTLRGLHSDVAAHLWGERLQRFRREGGADIGIDIAARLSESIDKLAYAHSIEPPRHASRAIPHGIQPHTRDTPSAPSRVPGRSAAPGGERGDLAKHLEADHAGAALHSEASDGLRKRTWEHIHTALRSARQGDATNARLHAELANAAFAEAAHYMSSEEFAEFAARVQAKLKELTEHGN